MSRKSRFSAIHEARRRWVDEHYAHVPEHTRPYDKQFSDKTANGLTTCITEYCKYMGWYAERINNMGKYDARSKKWIRSNMQRGTADISAIINGLPVRIEIKIGKDRLSKHQVNYWKAIEAAGGHYWVVKTWEDFLEQLNSII